MESIFSILDHIIRISHAISFSNMSLSKARDEGCGSFFGWIGDVGYVGGGFGGAWVPEIVIDGAACLFPPNMKKAEGTFRAEVPIPGLPIKVGFSGSWENFPPPCEKEIN